MEGWSSTLVVLVVVALFTASCHHRNPVQVRQEANARVFVFTDINIDAGDPDDRQSLVHLLWYADELDIEGIVPDRWDARGFEASRLAVEAYARDYMEYGFDTRGFPDPDAVEARIARDREHAFELFTRAAEADGSPLYVLVWGNMASIAEALHRRPDLAGRLRLISIGTGPMYEADMRYIPDNWERSEPCVQLNWNGHGRERIFGDPRFRDLWWLEINWTYNGMFTGEEPRGMFEKLTAYGAMGDHIEEVTAYHPQYRYFRVGDTPSVLYLIDPRGNLDDPARSSWAGQFERPLPEERPNYFADSSGPIEWNHSDPCTTWHNHPAVFDHARRTLEKERPGMYEALLRKLDQVYGK